MIWQDDAACAQVGGDWFFPDHGAEAKTIKRFCANCPVTVECLTVAMDERIEHGIWDGLTTYDRKKLRRGLAS